VVTLVGIVVWLAWMAVYVARNRQTDTIESGAAESGNSQGASSSADTRVEDPSARD